MPPFKGRQKDKKVDGVTRLLANPLRWNSSNMQNPPICDLRLNMTVLQVRHVDNSLPLSARSQLQCQHHHLLLEGILNQFLGGIF